MSNDNSRQRKCYYAIAGTACLDRDSRSGDNAGALSSEGLVGVFICVCVLYIYKGSRCAVSLNNEIS